jgi:hypothetical protein
LLKVFQYRGHCTTELIELVNCIFLNLISF